MKALTVLQPWAWAIASGLKVIENRSWRTPYRGPLLIHAGKSDRLVGCVDLPEAPALLTFGAIVAVAELVDCVDVRRAPVTRFTEGPICWVLRDVVQLQTPIAWTGERGLFDVPDEVVASQIQASRQSGLRA